MEMMDTQTEKMDRAGDQSSVNILRQIWPTYQRPQSNQSNSSNILSSFIGLTIAINVRMNRDLGSDKNYLQ